MRQLLKQLDLSKGFIIRNWSIGNIQVTSSMIRSSQNARERYESYLVENRILEEEEEKKLRKRFQLKENEKTKRNEIQ